MKIIHTESMSPTNLSAFENDMVYNGLDCCITREVWDAMSPELGSNKHPEFRATYEFSKALQGPVLEMNARGVRIDAARKTQVIDEFYDQLDHLERNLSRIVLEGVGLPGFNWRSNDDLKHLFYTRLGIPTIRYQGRVTVNRNALEKMEAYTIAKAIISHMSTMREIAKKISVLKTDVDADGRMRTSYNIAGTDTGRFSSSYSEYGTGGNLQNIEESLRSVFISDPGMKFAKFDAKSGESYVVGAIEWNLFNDAKYLDAVDSGDVHTAVAKICWPELHWTGDLSRDKDIAEQPYYRHYTYRFMCKKLGHGSNYGGKPETLAQQSKLPIGVVRGFQPKYFGAFPAHERWQGWVQSQIFTKGYLVSLTHRKRFFWGRRNDPDTIRAAIAFDPQGSLADIVNRAMLRIWRQRIAILMMQDHDALTFMYPTEQESEILPKLQSLLTEPIPLKNGRTLLIPYDCQVGWNRGKWDEEKNPNGLREWQGQDKRKRIEEAGILDRVIRRTNRRAG
jgi:DNA polymerase I-like protein with 3'-5' exonuclease and polymerase domains